MYLNIMLVESDLWMCYQLLTYLRSSKLNQHY